MSETGRGGGQGEGLPRPPQVGVTSAVIIGGSVALVLDSLSFVSRLHTLDLREQASDLVSGPSLHYGLDVDQILAVDHVVAVVLAVCAVGAAGVGWQVRSRSRPARVVLSALAVPLLLGSLIAGTLQASLLAAYLGPLVAAAAGTLWLQPARDWFNGVRRPDPATARAQQQRAPWPPPLPPTPTSPPTRTQTSTADPRSWPPPSLPGSAPAPPPPTAYGAPATGAAPAAPAAPAGSAQAGPRPTVVAWAAALTWIGSILVTSGAVAAIVLIVHDQDRIWRSVLRQNPDLTDQGVDQTTLIAGLIVVVCGLIVWAAAAAAAAYLVWRGAAWARTALAVSAAVAGALLLLGAASNPLLLLPTVTCAGAFVLLRRPETATWCRRRPGARP